MINPKITNKRIKGKRTSNHEIPVCPSLHIRFNIHVQNKIYINLKKNTIMVLGTRHEKLPK